MKVRVLYNLNNSISIIHPAPKSKKSNETEAEWLKRVFDKATPAGIEFEDINDTELPKDRLSRNRWTKKKGLPVQVNKDRL